LLTAVVVVAVAVIVAALPWGAVVSLSLSVSLVSSFHASSSLCPHACLISRFFYQSHQSIISYLLICFFFFFFLVRVSLIFCFY
jgi:hypothetical protein